MCQRNTITSSPSTPIIPAKTKDAVHKLSENSKPLSICESLTLWLWREWYPAEGVVVKPRTYSDRDRLVAFLVANVICLTPFEALS